MRYKQKIETWGLLTVMLALCFQSAAAQPHRPHAGHHGPHASAWLSGKVMEKDSTAVAFATVCLKGTHYGSTTDDMGRFRFRAPAGKHTLAVSIIGYETVEKNITVDKSPRNLTVVLQPAATELEAVVVTGGGVGRVRRSPFNAVAVDTKALQNTTKSLSDALTKLPGVKLRESGGVGSDMQLMLDGFSGKHVKVFIDGVPQEGAGQAFDLNNIPASFAERIEVYKGWCPSVSAPTPSAASSTSSRTNGGATGSPTPPTPTVRSTPTARTSVSGRRPGAASCTKSTLSRTTPTTTIISTTGCANSRCCPTARFTSSPWTRTT